MKSNMFILLGALAILGCNNTSDENTAYSRTLRIADISTNEPLANARVTLEQCSKHDLVFGCTRYSRIEILNTDDSGEVTLPNFDRITVEAAGYQRYSSKWPLSGQTGPLQGGIMLFLFPKSEIVLEIKGAATEVNAAYAFVQGCYFKEGREVSCLYRPYFYNGPQIPINSDTTITANGIGDLSITLEIYYLDLDYNLVETVGSGTHHTPRNARTNITIQL